MYTCMQARRQKLQHTSRGSFEDWGCLNNFCVYSPIGLSFGGGIGTIVRKYLCQEVVFFIPAIGNSFTAWISETKWTKTIKFGVNMCYNLTQIKFICEFEHELRSWSSNRFSKKIYTLCCKSTTYLLMLPRNIYVHIYYCWQAVTKPLLHHLKQPTPNIHPVQGINISPLLKVESI